MVRLGPKWLSPDENRVSPGMVMSRPASTEDTPEWVPCQSVSQSETNEALEAELALEQVVEGGTSEFWHAWLLVCNSRLETALSCAPR